MTDDGHIEDLLRRYQPAGPPPDLRARIVGPRVDRRRAWPWLAAAAALLIATIGLQIQTSRLGRAMQASERVDERTTAVIELQRSLGDSEEARQLAERVVQQRDLERLLELARTPVGTSGGAR